MHMGRMSLGQGAASPYSTAESPHIRTLAGASSDGMTSFLPPASLTMTTATEPTSPGLPAGSGQASRGLYRGIAPRADLVAVKVLNRYGEGTVENICTGIDWVLRNRMRYGINIVNISAGTAKEKQFDESSPLVRKVEELWDAGLVVVVSAGNRGPEAGTISAPGNSRKVITVGYYGKEGNSGTGPTIHCIKKPDVITPGSHIVSCHHTNIEKVPYTKKSGTSMATPVVSGGIALLLSLPKYRFYEPKEVKIRLKNSCTDLGLPHNKQGWGLFDLKRFLS